MTNDDLERQLRSQHGPRDEGYLPTNLPASLEQGRPAGAQPSRLVRIGAFVGVAAAAALVVAMVGGFFSGGDPGVGSSPSASGAAEPVACSRADVTLGGEPWGGAAGSRGTTVTITLAGGRDDCVLAPVTGAEITGGSPVGVSLASVNASGADNGPSVLLSADAAYTVGVAWSNWCGVTVPEPVTLALFFNGWPGPARVTVAPGGIDPVPPCSGGRETNLSVTDLQAR